LRAAFAQALDQPDTQRAAWLRELAEQQPQLAVALQSLLAQTQAPEVARAGEPGVGSRFGPWEIAALLGVGGMGRVYRACRADGEFSQTVALKLIAPGFDSPSLRQRFRRERQILARLEHPHIAHLIDGGVGEQGQLWLALELIDGQPITQWCQHQSAALDLRLQLFLSLCEAVAHAHRNLVLHRDIKPANVLVDQQGRLKLLDFGIASLLDDTDDPGAAPTRNAPLTIRYAAPEQIRQQRCTTATDVYALGVLLFELLSGRSPYAAAEAGQQSWVDASLQAVPDRLQTAARVSGINYSAVERRTLGGELQAIVRKALAKSPAERYASVMSLADDLQDVRAGRSARSGVAGRRAALQLWLRRYRWPLASAVLLLLALSVAAAVALREAREARAQSSRAQANYSALLSVLSAASPLDYVGREPVASEFLAAAATQIEQRLQHDAAARWRALEEIGHGLINLGRAATAVDVLQLAQTAQAADPGVSTNQQLDLLRLLSSAQGEPLPAADSARTASRIELLARRSDADPGLAADALARAASTLATHAQYPRATALFEQADALLAQHPAVPPALAENIERQRGQLWSRAGNLGQAEIAFVRALQIMQRHPEDFSALRRAEMQQALAELLIDTAQLDAAAEHLRAAASTYAREYPSEHPEQVRHQLLGANLALRSGQLQEARAALVALQGPLTKLSAATDIAHLAGLLRAELALLEGDCAASQLAVQQLQSRADLRQRRRTQLARVEHDMHAQCGAKAPH
jgi:serine/threonine-protein kinase